MAASNYLETLLLNSILRGGTWPSWTSGSHYVALFTAAPNDAGGGTEVSGTGYARVAVARGTGSWTAPADASGAQEVENEDPIAFPESEGSWGTVTHFALFDAATDGNMLYHGELSASRVVDGAGITVSFASGALKVRHS